MDLILAATSMQPESSGIFTATVVIAGFGIVLLTLALLIVIFNAFGNIVSASQNRAKKRKNKKLLKQIEADNASAQTDEVKNEPVLPPPPAVETGIRPEIIAAISAAVYEIEGAGAVITSVKRKKSSVNTRNAWAQAAVFDNTRPF